MCTREDSAITAIKLLRSMFEDYPDGVRNYKSDEQISDMISDFFNLIQLNNRNFSIDFEDQHFHDWLSNCGRTLDYFCISVNGVKAVFVSRGDFLRLMNYESFIINC